MTVLLDQRHMSGPHELADVHAIRRAWEQVAASRPFPTRMGRADADDRTLREAGRTLQAYVNEGRWVADCLECNGGIAAGPQFVDGCCMSCGTIWRLAHPPTNEVELAETILGARPPLNRHWKPWLETVDDLRAQNEVRGYVADRESPKGELEEVAAVTGLKVATVERIVRAQEELGLR